MRTVGYMLYFIAKYPWCLLIAGKK